jgi:hypothetical protein
MYSEAARAILNVPQDKCSWNNFIVSNDACFLWDSHGDEVEQWNKLADGKAGLDEAKIVYDQDGECCLTYKGRSVRVPLVGGREDNTIAIHTLSQLVAEDSEIRFCVDSSHSNDIAFLALPPNVWRMLESEFGIAAVAYRFLKMPASLEDFLQQAFSKENNRDYAEYEHKPTDQGDEGRGESMRPVQPPRSASELLAEPGHKYLHIDHKRYECQS